MVAAVAVFLQPALSAEGPVVKRNPQPTPTAAQPVAAQDPQKPVYRREADYSGGGGYDNKGYGGGYEKGYGGGYEKGYGGGEKYGGGYSSGYGGGYGGESYGKGEFSFVIRFWDSSKTLCYFIYYFI